MFAGHRKTSSSGKSLVTNPQLDPSSHWGCFSAHRFNERWNEVWPRWMRASGKQETGSDTKILCILLFLLPSRLLTLGPCSGSDCEQLQRNVLLQDEEWAPAQPGGLLLPSLLALLRLALLRSPTACPASRRQRRRRRDRDGPHPGCRAGPGAAGEERGAGSRAGGESQAGGGTGRSIILIHNRDRWKEQKCRNQLKESQHETSSQEFFSQMKKDLLCCSKTSKMRQSRGQSGPLGAAKARKECNIERHRANFLTRKLPNQKEKPR